MSAPTSPADKIIILGAPKSGTTSLANWLGDHPAVALARLKEPSFFTDFHERDWQGPGSPYFKTAIVGDPVEYEKLFENTKGATWGVDGSTDYLSCEVSPKKIRAYADIHKVKLICILRDPVARAFSEYAHTRRDRYETESFRRSLELEDARKNQNWTPLFRHMERSRYAASLNAYKSIFTEDELLIVPFEAIRDSGSLLARVGEFIGLAPHEYPFTGARNSSEAIRSMLLHSFTNDDKAYKRLFWKIFPQSIRQKLIRRNRFIITPAPGDIGRAYEILRDDIAAAARLAPFDTGHWTKYETNKENESR